MAILSLLLSIQIVTNHTMHQTPHLGLAFSRPDRIKGGTLEVSGCQRDAIREPPEPPKW